MQPVHVRPCRSASVLNACRCPGFLKLQKEACKGKSRHHCVSPLVTAMLRIQHHPAIDLLNLSRQAEQATHEGISRTVRCGRVKVCCSSGYSLCQLSDLHAGPIYGTDKLRLLGNLATPGSPGQIVRDEVLPQVFMCFLASHVCYVESCQV